MFMKYDEQIYRPPKEYKSILLQVTSGCTHNKCKFCGMYRYTNFKMESLDQIEEDVIEASQHPYYRGVKRVFLLNGNPFVLKTERLLKIAYNTQAPATGRGHMYVFIYQRYRKQV